MLKINKKGQEGQSLFEVVLSLAVISIIVVALVFLASNSVRNTTFSKNKTVSARFSQETVEWLRGERDSDWDAFFLRALTSENYCMRVLDWSDLGTCASDDYVDGTTLVRELTLTIISPDQVQAEVEVSWEDSQGAHQTRFVTDYTDWR